DEGRSRDLQTGPASVAQAGLDHQGQQRPGTYARAEAEGQAEEELIHPGAMPRCDVPPSSPVPLDRSVQQVEEQRLDVRIVCGNAGRSAERTARTTTLPPVTTPHLVTDLAPATLLNRRGTGTTRSPPDA